MREAASLLGSLTFPPPRLSHPSGLTGARPPARPPQGTAPHGVTAPRPPSPCAASSRGFGAPHSERRSPGEADLAPHDIAKLSLRQWHRGITASRLRGPRRGQSRRRREQSIPPPDHRISPPSLSGAGSLLPEEISGGSCRCGSRSEFQLLEEGWPRGRAAVPEQCGAANRAACRH